MDPETVTRYSFPDTSDKRDDETWMAYWDRKRHEAHGGVVRRYQELTARTRDWRHFLAVAHEEIDPGDDLLPMGD
jgi:hypothetical protein